MSEFIKRVLLIPYVTYQGFMKLAITAAQFAITIAIIVAFCGAGAYIASLPFGEFYIPVRVVTFIGLFLCLSVGMEGSRVKRQVQRGQGMAKGVKV